MVRGKGKELRSGDVSACLLDSQWKMGDRQLDSEMWDSHQRYPSERHRNIDL